jgi:hypothetical protein
MKKIVSTNNKQLSAKALRFNEGKLDYSLLEPYAIQELVRVFNEGSKKYAKNNWLNGGMDYSKLIASLKRHIAAFEMGEDLDIETGCHHMAHAAWNALGLVSYSKYFPENDDRIIPELMKKANAKRTK